MWHPGARITFVLSSSFLAACGAKTLDITGPDGGAGNSGAGGTSGTGGAAGAGASNPGPYVTSSIYGAKISKLDLLFMIDNSSSMADKQVILRDAVPELVDRLIEPRCVDPVTGAVVGNAVNGACPLGVLSFQPIKDIHIGIISSSLGNHGAAGVCEDAIDVSLGRSYPHNDDRGHLVTRGVGGTNVPTFQYKGFLYYNPSVAGGLANAAQVATPFVDLLHGVGQHGCGYEAPLEAAYRFLVDPDPYDAIRVDKIFDGIGIAVLEGTDRALLQQRADFLRPDSLVSIVLVTDENDCSVIEGGQNFFALLPPASGTGKSVLKRGTSVCQTNPNDQCCFSCGSAAPPPGCAPANTDSECMKGDLTASEDPINLRCFDQKKKYGVDFLYPVKRYIDAFSGSKVPNREQTMVDNPLFSDINCRTGAACAPPRDKSLVLFTGIVGVPWQDIAIDPNDLSIGYKNAKQLRNENIWANIVGDPLNASGPTPPRDPHMIESTAPRLGLAGPESGPRADPIHGHEWLPSRDVLQPDGDLQFACIFDLRFVKICVEPQDCACFGPAIGDVMNPVCQNAQGAYTTTHARGSAYPGTRILQVLQGLGDQAIVGSICPAQSTDPTRADFGYTPVINAVIDRLRRPLADPCLPVALPVDPATGKSPCHVIEVFNGPACNCNAEPGRGAAPNDLLTEEMRAAGTCFCEITQFVGDAAHTCRAQLNPPANSGDGWCYIDPAQQSDATCDLVRTCRPEEQRKIRFPTLNSEPRPGAKTFLRCETPPLAAPPPSRCP